jgi:hypothetical protein
MPRRVRRSPRRRSPRGRRRALAGARMARGGGVPSPCAPPGLHHPPLPHPHLLLLGCLSSGRLKATERARPAGRLCAALRRPRELERVCTTSCSSCFSPSPSPPPPPSPSMPPPLLCVPLLPLPPACMHRSRARAPIPHACIDPARLHRSRTLALIPHTRIDPAKSRRSRHIRALAIVFPVHPPYARITPTSHLVMLQSRHMHAFVGIVLGP